MPADTPYAIGDVAAILAVSPDTVRRWVDGGRLPARRDAGGRRTVAPADLAAFARARLGGTGPSQTSARNRFPGIVTDVRRDGVTAQVELVCGPHRVVALVSREAADDLGLAPGRRVVASVKATTVTVDLAAP